MSEYVCSDCGNRLPESAACTVVQGSTGPVRLQHRPVCCRGEMIRGSDCPGCDGSGRVIFHGGGDFAEVRSCRVCGTGEKLADTMFPNCTTAA